MYDENANLAVSREMRDEVAAVVFNLFIFGVTYVFTDEVLGASKPGSIHAAWVFTLFTSVFTVSLVVLKKNREMVQLIQQKHHERTEALADIQRNYFDHLNLDQKFYKDPWLMKLQHHLVDIDERADDRSYTNFQYQMARDYITRGLESCKEFMESGHRVKCDEAQRKDLLKELIDKSEQEILAVSCDRDSYLDEFWHKEATGRFAARFGAAYTDSNLSAAKRGVSVKRIFVVRGEFLDFEGDVPEKTKKLIEVVSFMTSVQNIENRFVKTEDIDPPELRDALVSFMVCDHWAVSEAGRRIESGDAHEPERFEPGYVAYNVDPAKLLDLFTKLDFISYSSDSLPGLHKAIHDKKISMMREEESVTGLQLPVIPT